MEISEYFRFLVALVFVLGLIVSLALIARKAGFGTPASALKPAGQRRLSIIEATSIDSRRRLVLVRRDDVEHLLLLGPTNETVVESRIAVRPDAATDKDAEAETEGKGT